MYQLFYFNCFFFIFKFFILLDYVTHLLDLVFFLYLLWTTLLYFSLALRLHRFTRGWTGSTPE